MPKRLLRPASNHTLTSSNTKFISGIKPDWIRVTEVPLCVCELVWLGFKFGRGPFTKNVVATVSDFTCRAQDPQRDIKFQPSAFSMLLTLLLLLSLSLLRFLLLLCAVFLTVQPVSVPVAQSTCPAAYFLPAAPLVTVAAILCWLLIAFLTLHASASIHSGHAPAKHQHSLLHNS